MEKGKTLGEMTPEERREAVKRAVQAYQEWLNVHAVLIGAALSDEPEVNPPNVI